MSILSSANQSDWSAFLNPDAAPVGPRKIAFPRLLNGPITRSNVGGRFSLLGNGYVSIAAVRGLVIRVRKGVLWITQGNDTIDHVVRAGEHFVADRTSLLIISAFERGEVEVEWPSRARGTRIVAYARVAAAA
ncbi:MAG: DUF2917 domain-containing protein [Burkholderiales bacterium]